MTRDQQVCNALELLAPSLRERAECEHDIGLALDRVEQRMARSFRVAGSKKGKAGLRRYLAALRRLRQAYYSLDPAIRPWFSLAERAYVSGKPSVIDREITIAEAFLAQPSPSPRRDASRNKVAVEVARHLLDWWGHKDELKALSFTAARSRLACGCVITPNMVEKGRSAGEEKLIRFRR